MASSEVVPETAATKEETVIPEEGRAHSPTSVLVSDEVERWSGLGPPPEAAGNNPPLVTEDMIKEEMKLEEERKKQEAVEVANMSEPKMGDSMFNKLDELLNQTQLYSEFLLEKMDDIATESVDAVASESPVVAVAGKGKGRKRKAAAKGAVARKKAKEAFQAMLANCDEDVPLDAASECLSEEEILWKEQMKIAPLLTGGRLKVYQLKGIKWLISLWQNGLNGILADQMGLGKTVQTVGFLAHLKGMGMHGPFMVCAPLSTLSNWVNEVTKWVPGMNVLLYHGTREERMVLRRKHMPLNVTPSFPVIVTSYEVVMNDRAFLRKYKWKYIVVDEGHRLKNFDCKLLRELRQIPSDNTLLLTGTPLQNNLVELWSLLNFILPSIFTSLKEFQSWFDFSGRSASGSKEDLDDQRQLKVISKLHLILRPFLLRRLKEDVEKSLPLKKEIILYAQMSPQQKDFQEQLINKTLESHLEENAQFTGGPSMKTRLNSVFMQLRKNCNHPDLLISQFEYNINWPPVKTLLEQCGKLQLLDRLIKEMRSRGHKVLIFSQMTRMLDILAYYLSEAGFEPFRIDGNVKQTERQRQIEEFNKADSKNFIFLLSTRAGGLGINLTSADTVIIYDSDWNPHMDMQAMDRCHRIGQTKPVHVYRLATAHSCECRMLKVAAEKLQLEHLVIEKGQFRQERELPKITLQEADLLDLLKLERDQEEEYVQSSAISDENLVRILDRSDMILSANAGDVKIPEVDAQSLLKGPGWEVVVRSGKSNLLSSIEGYRKI